MHSNPEMWPQRLAIGEFAGNDNFALIPGICPMRKGRLKGELGPLAPDKFLELDQCLDDDAR